MTKHRREPKFKKGDRITVIGNTGDDGGFRQEKLRSYGACWVSYKMDKFIGNQYRIEKVTGDYLYILETLPNFYFLSRWLELAYSKPIIEIPEDLFKI